MSASTSLIHSLRDFQTVNIPPRLSRSSCDFYSLHITAQWTTTTSYRSSLLPPERERQASQLRLQVLGRQPTAYATRRTTEMSDGKARNSENPQTSPTPTGTLACSDKQTSPLTKHNSPQAARAFHFAVLSAETGGSPRPQRNLIDFSGLRRRNSRHSLLFFLPFSAS